MKQRTIRNATAEMLTGLFAPGTEATVSSPSLLNFHPDERMLTVDFALGEQSV